MATLDADSKNEPLPGTLRPDSKVMQVKSAMDKTVLEALDSLDPRIPVHAELRMGVLALRDLRLTLETQVTASVARATQSAATEATFREMAGELRAVATKFEQAVTSLVRQNRKLLARLGTGSTQAGVLYALRVQSVVLFDMLTVVVEMLIKLAPDLKKDDEAGGGVRAVLMQTLAAVRGTRQRLVGATQNFLMLSMMGMGHRAMFLYCVKALQLFAMFLLLQIATRLPQAPRSLLTISVVFMGGFVVCGVMLVFGAFYVASLTGASQDVAMAVMTDVACTTFLVGMVAVALADLVARKKYFQFRHKQSDSLAFYSDTMVAIGGLVLLIPFGLL
jgi:hypothetical protein